MSYNGPTRQEILLQVMKYNQNHEKSDQIKVNYASREMDYVPIEQIVKDEARASESAKLLRETVKDVHNLKREQLKKGPPSSRNDWIEVRAIGKKLIEAAEKAIWRLESEAPQHPPNVAIDSRPPKNVMKPPPLPSAHHDLKKPHSSRDLKKPDAHTDAHPETKKPAGPTTSHPEAQKQATHTKPQETAKPQAHNSTPRHETKKHAASEKGRETNHLTKEQEENRRRREEYIRQKEQKAHLEAQSLHSEVRKYGDEV